MGMGGKWYQNQTIAPMLGDITKEDNENQMLLKAQLSFLKNETGMRPSRPLLIELAPGHSLAKQNRYFRSTGTHHVWVKD